MHCTSQAGVLQRRPGTAAAAAAVPIQGTQGAEAYHPNTTVRMLKGPDWQRLLLLVGDSLMLHLLAHTSIFVPLPNGCFLQVSGPAIAQVCLCGRGEGASGACEFGCA